MDEALWSFIWEEVVLGRERRRSRRRLRGLGSHSQTRTHAPRCASLGLGGGGRRRCLRVRTAWGCNGQDAGEPVCPAHR